MRFVWENVVGLVIEDSQLAIGIVVALAITWGLSTLGDKVQDVIGWLLLALLIIVLLGNLVVTVRRAKRRLA
ncbi:MAG TPA: hypothetical protein VEP48_12300 [Methylomirabilota bacterium]|nr:hypothetical protein [Methylomirabilota bacterium]